MSNLLSAAGLHELLAAHAPVHLLDVRWSLADPDGHASYLRGHLPGAVWVDLEHELSRPGTPAEGRHPLPPHALLQAAAVRWGLRDGEPVVVYDDSRGLGAARAWWMLRRAGVAVRVLDGGLAAWIAAGHRLEQGEAVPDAGAVTLVDTDAGELTIDQAAAFPASGVLIDARATERYRGETEPVDPVAGHIPGAVNVPMASLLRPDGTLREAAELDALLAAAGVRAGTPVAAYCGSGVTAAHTALVLGELGVPVSVFTGSWSAWSNTPGRPVATGS